MLTQDTEMDEQNTQSPKQQALGALVEGINLAEKLTKDELTKIGTEAKEGYETDCHSRQEWEKSIAEWTKLAKQTIEKKSFPWQGASNVKYPLLSTAAMQFAARAYPSLLPSDGRLVKAKVLGKDPDGKKKETAEAVSIYMSYQLLDEMDGWEEEMDRLLIMLPIVGTIFKKTYWDSIKKTNCSKVVLPKNLVVNYWAKSLREAERISEVLEINPRMLKERQQAKLWLDTELGDPSVSEADESLDNYAPSQTDATTPYIFVEQHTYLDLDDDGYKEPYIVTFHRMSGKVFRIVARYDDKTTFFDDEGNLVKIEPVQYYTKFGFVPNPDGGFYDIGFGILLGPLNESVNTLINQLVDAGTLNNMQAGFIGKGLRLRMGETKFNPGEWKAVNGTGDDLKKQIVPLPSKEPSHVLFQLMEALISSGKELASVAEIFVGKMPGQNTPATTTMASIEQGMKVFTAVYKRIYRSLSEEFDKLYRLNGLYLNPQTYVDVVDMAVGPDDFDYSTHRICPGADPTAVSQTEKLLKAQGLMEMLGAGMPLNPVVVMKRMLEAQEQPNWEELIPPEILQSGQMPPPPPDPKVQALQMKAQMDAQAGQQDMAIKERQAKLDEAAQHQDIAAKAAESQISLAEKTQAAKLKLGAQVSADQARIAQAHQQHAQDMQHSQEQHSQKMEQLRQTNAAKPKGNTKK
jgi:chaperonin GroES